MDLYPLFLIINRSPSESKSNIVQFQLFPLRKTGKTDAYMMYKQDICINHIYSHILIINNLLSYKCLPLCRKLEKVVFPGRMAIEVMSSCSGGRCRALPLQHCRWWWPVVSSNSCTVVFPVVKTWVVQCQVAGIRRN